jgi:hypothetical protein
MARKGFRREGSAPDTGSAGAAPSRVLVPVGKRKSGGQRQDKEGKKGRNEKKRQEGGKTGGGETVQGQGVRSVCVCLCVCFCVCVRVCGPGKGSKESDEDQASDLCWSSDDYFFFHTIFLFIFFSHNFFV